MTMTTTPLAHSDPRMAAAIKEITEMILRSYPGTSFTVDFDAEEQQEAVFVTAVVDVDDPDEVVDCFIDRVLTLQIDEGLPLHIIPIRTPARRDQLQASLGWRHPSGKETLSAVG